MKGQLNDYKYIVVPKRFEAFKIENRHQTSTMVKHFFALNGFNAVYEDVMPEDLANNRCLGLTADLLDNSSLFTTKTIIVLRDCQNNEVFRTIEGRSRSKEFRIAYKEAIENSFASFKSMDYAYKPKKEVVENKKEAPITVSFKNDIKSLENKPDSKVVEQEATPENQTYKDRTPKPSTMTKVDKVEEMATEIETKKPVSEPQGSLLYAQPIDNGYQLIDSTPKVIMKLQKTSVDNIFLADYDGKNGMVYKKGDKWLLEYSENGKTQQKELNIKF
ncbi:hypothetical protein DX873_00400 [Flagellimonas nanhaiensis]|uniref:Uncharacterized protein n=2 Tax=Flagellimonas nanhaiensis TaxID=2292706 RepID=A0A371JS94_9FLAO|nr:hypothetical protein DX873_00400 [Allomuricauda nanhaiensis]